MAREWEVVVQRHHMTEAKFKEHAVKALRRSEVSNSVKLGPIRYAHTADYWYAVASEIDVDANQASTADETEKCPDTYSIPIGTPWICFHCGERFTTPGAARDHFGSTPASVPGCIIKAGEERGLLMALRKAEKEIAHMRAALPDLSMQHFANYDQWVTRATMFLAGHPKYGPDFRAVCFDTKGRHCKRGADFMRARDEGAFPVYWLWPDQIGAIALGLLQREAQ